MKPPPSKILAVLMRSPGAEYMLFLQTTGTGKGWKTGVTGLSSLVTPGTPLSPGWAHVCP